MLCCYHITYFNSTGYLEYRKVLNRVLRKIIFLLIESTSQVCLCCGGGKEGCRFWNISGSSLHFHISTNSGQKVRCPGSNLASNNTTTFLVSIISFAKPWLVTCEIQG